LAGHHRAKLRTLSGLRDLPAFVGCCRASQHTLEEVLDAMRAARVPAGPILRPIDLLSEPQFVERGMFQRAAPPRPRVQRTAVAAGGGDAASERGGAADADQAASASTAAARNEELVMPAILPVMQGTPGATRWAGASLGHHTEEVLAGELGLGDDDIRRLRSLEVIA
jgi:crotonobetainyl-CoA:carnitine CoA-transferase CaiB-like acyl-CoA transferase